jgi:hypothetical protein
MMVGFTNTILPCLTQIGITTFVLSGRAKVSGGGANEESAVRAGSMLVLAAAIIEFVVGVVTQIIFPAACNALCPVDCPFPAHFNHNAVYHIGLATAWIIRDTGVIIMLSAIETGTDNSLAGKMDKNEGIMV